MGTILQHSRFRHWYLDQLADQEEEASGFEKKSKLASTVHSEIG